MVTVSLELPDSVLALSALSREEFVADAKFLLAAKLFELGRLSSGRAAEACGMPRADFLLSLERVGVSMIQMDVEDLRDELSRV